MRLHVNCLDDETVILEWLENIFYDEIFDLKVFSNPDEFIKAFNDGVDLVITDMRVPGYDPYAALKYFKTIRKNGLYIIVISAYFDVPMCKQLFELGVDRIIEKGATIKWIHEIAKYVNDLFPRIYERAKLLA